ncbi:MAG: 3-deoxy-7-phosphoheptulonate synthase [Bacteroidetes bacterium GWF2_38_335]|nr:MAG: 3-deoxy-7-phosphoheptulonate synthase [Bacteroidetes bacterium GWF2_38_335]OFY80236.1 MAG: 3-deoxy-7-phosphoheptulonate synthase [Bacteroidetes bacterium RIFOXYA12_FULL_38_20]HBS88737.1 3-deoxy-7-phosphoheptulonate synthase [Bacteroidales bacterium]
MEQNQENNIFESWFGKTVKTPFIISGPCSAESLSQLTETARLLAATNKISVFRAGIWKPRTRPGSFEGAGEKGLGWLKKAKDETGFRTIVEIAHPKHIDLCNKYDVDMFWIGARTTSNPFSIQELCEAIKGTDKPVFIKNPVNPDIELWIGAIERFKNAGISKIAAIHRGFYPFEKTIFRNMPKWEVAIELKIRLPHLPVLCDPSHIAGDRQFLAEISQKALDLNMDGLMIESHPCPEKAHSDANQQITPQNLNKLIDSLVFRKPDNAADDFHSLLNKYRDQIDSLDFQLIDLLSKRMNVVEKIGLLKKDNAITILQLRRWQDIIKSRTKYGLKLGLSEELVEKLLGFIHKESIQKQTDIMNDRKNQEK